MNKRAVAPDLGMATLPERLDRTREVREDVEGAIAYTEALEKMYAEGTPAHRQCREIITKLTRALSNL